MNGLCDEYDICKLFWAICLKIFSGEVAVISTVSCAVDLSFCDASLYISLKAVSSLASPARIFFYLVFSLFRVALCQAPF